MASHVRLAFSLRGRVRTLRSPVIQTGSTPLTLINMFTVPPERQRVLIARLLDATDDYANENPDRSQTVTARSSFRHR